MPTFKIVKDKRRNENLLGYHLSEEEKQKTERICLRKVFDGAWRNISNRIANFLSENHAAEDQTHTQRRPRHN